MHRLLTPSTVTHNACVKLVGEHTSVEHAVAKAFPAELASLIEEMFLQEQVFNADKTGLFWKKMPTRTLISQCKSKAAALRLQRTGYP